MGTDGVDGTDGTDGAEGIDGLAGTDDPLQKYPAVLLEWVPMKNVGDPVQIGAGPLWFTDVSEAVGVSESDSAGLAFVDFDDDGWPDLVGGGDEGLTVYRNVGGSFVRETALVLGDISQAQRSGGVPTFGDVDGDGDLDLFVASVGEADTLYLNDGFGFYQQAPDNGGIPAYTASQAGSFVDVDRDGDLDLYLARGRRLDAPNVDAGSEGSPNVLFLNDGAGHFSDVTDAWNAAAGENSETFQGLFADFDRDGDQDGLVLRDFLRDHYLRNDGTRFDDSGAAISPNDTTLMGAAVGDIDGDGHLDVFCTNGPQDFIYRGGADGTFENVFAQWLDGGDPTTTTSGWGVALVDLDNDGDQDVISVAADDLSGHVSSAKVNPGAYVVFENTGGRLTDVTEAAGLGGINAYALAMADFDLDGDIDIAVGAKPSDEADVVSGIRILRNDTARGAGNQFVELSLRAPSGNTGAVGAILDIEVGTLRTSRVVTAGESHLSAHSFVQHFGLGSATHADRITITWPDGTVQIATNVPAGYHRLAPSTGACCVDTAGCEEPACPTWYPSWDLCQGATDCDPCDLACAHLQACGLDDFGCDAECAAEGLHPVAIRCMLESPCEDAFYCLGESGDDGEPRR